jgi:hypothetical protein
LSFSALLAEWNGVVNFIWENNAAH